MANILVIDDDIAICRLIETALTRDGHVVFIKNSATEVVVNDFKQMDLILLDIMMPKLDGISFCKEYRSMIDCPILFLTAKTMEQDVVDGLSVGGDDYIKKPFSVSELRARVNAHIRREHRDRHQSLILNDCVFDLSEKTVSIKNKLILLTKSEYEICELLARNKGQIFSLENILEKIFGFQSESDISSIRVHIKNIRSKFNEVTDCPIETVWGVGYKWK
ncbi:response regulator transcription factor [Anaerotignum sp.]|uniref:response regulator transcription factor n=1 Tax=Anaerotignum sp. TaxID=2039241 RepID=UPI00289D01E7|nr:response regulator transcription factor [Anaerotignum sp.]